MENIDSLKTISLLLERFSHSIRTHLGVGLGALNDLVEGVELSKEDLEDGKTSLVSILKVLDSIKPLSISVSSSREFIDLKEAVELSGLNLETIVETSIQVEQELFPKALVELQNYLKHKSETDSSVEVSLDTSEVTPVIVLAATTNLEERTESLEELFTRDHSIDSIGLIFANEVLKVHGFSAELVSRSGSSQFRINLS